MGPGMGSERAHQRWQWHLRGGKSRFGGLQGLQKGFPLRLLTLMLWFIAWSDHSPVPPGRLCAAGVRGARGCPGHKSPRRLAAGWWWWVMMLTLEGPATVCFTHIGRQRAVLPRSCPQTALLESSTPVWQRSPLRGCPEKRRNKWSHSFAERSSWAWRGRD